MDKGIYDNYLAILKSELLPAMGCTEPVAIAYCAALARAALGKSPESIKVYCSGNIVKNASGVTVPNSGGQKGIAVAATLGAIGGREDLGLEALSAVTPDQIERAKGLAASRFCDCSLVESDDPLYIRIEAFCGEESALCEIKTKHDHIARIERNGAILVSNPDVQVEKAGDKSLMTLEGIKEFADTVSMEDVGDIITRQIECNSAISSEGLANPWGACVGRTILENSPNHLAARLIAYAAAGSDARMGGCPLPVVINSGSGNQGITVAVPVAAYAKDVGCNKEKLCRALVFANLISLHQKRFIGDLSAYCGVVSAASSAACGIAYIDGASMSVIGQTITNAICTIGGMVCDGAKPSCAAKIACAVNVGLMGYEMAKNGRGFTTGEGLASSDAEKTIRNMGRVGRDGMRYADTEILNIMLGK